MIFSIIFIVCLLCFIIHLMLGINCPVIHVSTKQVYLWWWWKIKNLGEVTYVLSIEQENTLIHKLNLRNKGHFSSLLDYRRELERDYNILVYFSNRIKNDYHKTLTFRSPGERTLFLMRYL